MVTNRAQKSRFVQGLYNIHTRYIIEKNKEKNVAYKYATFIVFREIIGTMSR